MTRISLAIATNILRWFSACKASFDLYLIFPSFVTPSTSMATSSPNSSSRVSRERPYPLRHHAKNLQQWSRDPFLTLLKYPLLVPVERYRLRQICDIDSCGLSSHSDRHAESDQYHLQTDIRSPDL